MTSTTTLVAAGLTAMLLIATPATHAAPDAPVSAAAIEAATRPAERTAIATLFEDEAASVTKKSEMRAEMATTDGGPGGKPFNAALAQHCAALAKEYKAAPPTRARINVHVLNA